MVFFTQVSCASGVDSLLIIGRMNSRETSMIHLKSCKNIVSLSVFVNNTNGASVLKHIIVYT